MYMLCGTCSACFKAVHLGLFNLPSIPLGEFANEDGNMWPNCTSESTSSRPCCGENSLPTEDRWEPSYPKKTFQYCS